MHAHAVTTPRLSRLNFPIHAEWFVLQVSCPSFQLLRQREFLQIVREPGRTLRCPLRLRCLALRLIARVLCPGATACLQGWALLRSIVHGYPIPPIHTVLSSRMPHRRTMRTGPGLEGQGTVTRAHQLSLCLPSRLASQTRDAALAGPAYFCVIV